MVRDRVEPRYHVSHTEVRSTMTATTNERPKLLYVLMYLLGGASLGTGILNLYWSFGWEGGDLNGNFAGTGFSGIDNIALLSNFDFAIVAIVVGLSLLVVANMNAWKETDGY